MSSNVSLDKSNENSNKEIPPWEPLSKNKRKKIQLCFDQIQDCYYLLIATNSQREHFSKHTGITVLPQKQLKEIYYKLVKQIRSDFEKTDSADALAIYEEVFTRREAIIENLIK